MVRLKTELSLERGLSDALNTALANEARSAKLGLDEELAVHDGRGRVEWSVRHGRVDVVLGSNGVSNQEPGRLELVEATGIVEASQNSINVVWSDIQQLSFYL